MIRQTILLAGLTAAMSFAQGLTATSPLVPLNNATFGGSGIPNQAVAVQTITDGTNTIVLGLTAHERFAAPPVTNNGAGTFFAPVGGGPNPALAQWNFAFHASALTNTGADAQPSYIFDVLYDMDPGPFTDQSQLGRIQLTGHPNPDYGVAQGPAFVVGLRDDSQNLGFGDKRLAIPGFQTPPVGYANPGGVPFNPNIPGHYTFALRVFNLAGVELGRVVIHVSTSGNVLPNPGGSYQMRYISNLNLGDSVINITNSGARGAGLFSGTSSATTGAICVNVYAFSPDEQMVSCCSCPVTPNGLVSLSAKDDLTSNTLTPAVPTSIVVKLVASIPQNGGSGCSMSATSVTPLTAIPLPGQLAPGLHAWATTIHTDPTSAPTVTETPFSPASLSVTGAGGQDVGELIRLTQLCTFINATGSGFGICRSCRLGGLGAGRL
jgi:hypothetical protein